MWRRRSRGVDQHAAARRASASAAASSWKTPFATGWTPPAHVHLDPFRVTTCAQLKQGRSVDLVALLDAFLDLAFSEVLVLDEEARKTTTRTACCGILALEQHREHAGVNVVGLVDGFGCEQVDRSQRRAAGESSIERGWP